VEEQLRRREDHDCFASHDWEEDGEERAQRAAGNLGVLLVGSCGEGLDNGGVAGHAGELSLGVPYQPGALLPVVA